MSYYERSQRPMSNRYYNPFDNMMDAFSRFNEAFYALSESLAPRYSGDRFYSDRLLDQPLFERPLLDRPFYDRPPYYERGIEKPQEKGREKVRPQEKEKELEKEKPQERVTKGRPEETTQETQMAPSTRERPAAFRHDRPLGMNLLERPIMDVLGVFEDPFFKSNWESHSTFDRAHRLLEEMINKGRPNINLSKDDELLRIPEEFEDVYREFGDRGDGGVVTGTSYQTSNITKDGKTVTVVRQSKLNPDGSISTKVSQHFDDGKGQRDTRSRKKKINYKTGTVKDTVSEAPKLQAEKEKPKADEIHKEEQSAKEAQIRKEAENMPQGAKEK